MHGPDLPSPPYDVAAPSDTLGARHVALALEDLDFPATREELVRRAGGWRIPITGVRFLPLAELLDGVRDRTFRSAGDVARAIERAHPEMREKRTNTA